MTDFEIGGIAPPWQRMPQPAAPTYDERTSEVSAAPSGTNPPRVSRKQTVRIRVARAKEAAQRGDADIVIAELIGEDNTQRDLMIEHLASSPVASRRMYSEVSKVDGLLERIEGASPSIHAAIVGQVRSIRSGRRFSSER